MKLNTQIETLKIKQLSLFKEEKQLLESDEWYTFSKTVEAIEIYLKPNSKILTLFCWKNSNFVKVFENKGHSVIYSHIEKENKKDFFTYTKEDVKDIDYIIDNPPFSKRNEVFNKLFKLEKPFAMLVPLVSITKKVWEIELIN